MVLPSSAADVVSRAEDVAATMARYQRALAAATGQTVAAIEAEMGAGTIRTAGEAAAFGLVDGLVGND